jgi:RNA polymerase sigma-70 factor (ECF subfamily)
MPHSIADHVIARAQAGDSDAIATLYECYKNKVYRYLYYRTGEHHAAEDLTAEVFMRAIKSLPHYRQRAVPIHAWLLQIARNLAIDHSRRMSVRRHHDLDENLVDPAPTPEMIAERRLEISHMWDALRRLTADQCDVIILRFLSDMSIAEVARLLNKSESAVKTLQMRGLAALERILTARKITYG